MRRLGQRWLTVLPTLTVQDLMYEAMDTGAMHTNEGLTKLVVMAVVRGTCSRPGAFGKDEFDLSGLISKWSKDGDHVLKVEDLTWSREGLRIELPDGTEEHSLRGELQMERIKGFLEEAAAGGYEYSMSLTADTLAIARRVMTIFAMYQWRRGLFAVQYKGMSPSEIEKALELRAAGYEGGMPVGAVIDEAEAIQRWEKGEKAYLPQLKGEPLVVMYNRRKMLTTDEVTTAYITKVFHNATMMAGFRPGSGGVNCMRRAVMNEVRRGAEKLGLDSAMNAKRMVNHRSDGHKAREGTYEDSTSSTDMMAFLMGREPQKLESLKSLSSLRVPEVSKYVKPSDVPKRDPVWKRVTQNEELKQFERAVDRHELLVQLEPSNEQVKERLAVLVSEHNSLHTHLSRMVLKAKQEEVYKKGVLALETMPLEEVQVLHEVNSFEGVSVAMLLERYGCGADVPFEAVKILKERKVGKGKSAEMEYLIEWRGYTVSRSSWEVHVEDSLIKAFEAEKAASVDEKAAKPVTVCVMEAEGMTNAVESGLEPAEPVAQVAVAEAEAAMREAEATAAKVEVLMAERVLELENELARMQMGTPMRAGTRPEEAPLSKLATAHKREEELVVRFHSKLAECKGVKQDALTVLSREMGGMSLETLRKKIARAEMRMAAVAAMSVTIKFEELTLPITCRSEGLVSELIGQIASVIHQPKEDVRLCIDGERLGGEKKVSEVLSEGCVIDAFAAAQGGGWGIDPVWDAYVDEEGERLLSPPEGERLLSPGGTQEDEPMSQRGTEVDAASMAGGESEHRGSQQSPVSVHDGEHRGSQDSPVSLHSDDGELQELKLSLAASLERLPLPVTPGKRPRELMSKAAAAGESGKAAAHVDLTDDEFLKQLDAEVAASEARLEAARAGLAKPREQQQQQQQQQQRQQQQAPAPLVVNPPLPREQSFQPNEEQAEAMRLMAEGKSVVVVGAAGTGKTALIVEKTLSRLETTSGKVLVVAPYNTHVDKVRADLCSIPKLKAAIEAKRVVVKTAAAAFAYPLQGMARAHVMEAQLPAKMRALLREKELFLIIDESALISFFKRDATDELLQMLRGSSEADGGVQVMEVQDPLQAEVCHSAAEKTAELTKAGDMMRELNIEGKFMNAKDREVVFLTRSQRFIGPLKETYEEGAKELRGGCTGAAARKLVDTGLARVLTPAEELEKMTLYGTSREVMDNSIGNTLRRAAERGHTVANGGVWIFKSWQAAGGRYEEEQLNEMRKFGFETLAIAKGERMLLIQKKGVRDEEDEEIEMEDEEDEAMRFSDKKYATGNMPCEVIDFEVDKWVKVKALTRPEGANILYVPVALLEKGGVALDLIGLKPFMERVVDLAQGLEWTGPVHVVATKIFGRGKFYVAVTRCRDLRMLKISGLNGYDDLRRVVKSNWRAIDFHVQHGQEMPASSKRFAAKMKEKFEKLKP